MVWWNDEGAAGGTAVYLWLEPSLQLTPKAFASRLAGRRDERFEFMKHIADVAKARFGQR
jgi:hypothetical protein